MTPAERARAQRRAHKLKGEGRSIRVIAATLGVSKSTVGEWLKAEAPAVPPQVAHLQTEDGKPVAGAEPGNTRALTHGATSPAVWGPVAEDIASEIDLAVVGTPAAHPIFSAARHQLACAMARMRLLDEHIDRRCDGLLFDAETNQPHGFADLYLKQARTISRCMEQMGMTPAAAAKLNLHVAQAEGEAARMQREQREREALRRQNSVDGEAL